MKSFKQNTVAIAVAVAFSTSVVAQDNAVENADEKGLERITVTAQKRVQSIQEVPISIATLSNEELNTILAAGDDILSIALRIPGLYAESSNGRVAPRFYIRGLGNTDFDVAASQPVSIVMDDVVMENVVLKSFPLFDIQQVEVIRGPQGTLFGRNTTAGIVKFDTVKPSEDFEAYVKAGFASYGTRNLQAAVGGEIAEDISGRFSLLSQHRDDYINNLMDTENGDTMGAFQENAWRAQLLFTPSDDLSILANVHGRDLNGTASMFRANVFTRGSNELNNNYRRRAVYYDGNLNGNGFDNNPQEYNGLGGSVKIDYDLGDMTLTSITAYEEADGFSLGDIDGGFGSAAPFTPAPVPGFIPFDAVTQDKLDALEQITQEVRLASDTDEDLSWQVGAFFFDSSFNVTSTDGFFGASTVFHDNTTKAVFAQSSYKFDSQLTVTAGIRYTEDKKSLRVGQQNTGGFCNFTTDNDGNPDPACFQQDYDDIARDDGQVSYELSANYRMTDNTSLFARFANGFRAQTIQGRDVAFEGAPSVADAETINSVEAGFKSDLLDNTLRLNAAVFMYEIDDIQLSAIGGGANNTALVNADKGTGYGFEVDARWLASENLLFTAGYSFNKTELKDDVLTVLPCGANPIFGATGNCTVLDPRPDGFRASIDGNPFPQAPETTFNFTARYSVPAGDDGEIYVFTDWAFQGETSLFLYESVEFTTDDQFEGGLRIGYENFAEGYSVSLFGRNITDEDNVKGGIDFNNLTGIVNEGRIVGVEFKVEFY